MIRRYIVFLLAVAAVLVTALAHRSSAPREWPDSGGATRLKFSHSFHVKEAGMACADCHPGAAASSAATDNLRSNHDNCVSCHEEQIGSECGYCHKDPDNISASPVPTRDILFSHSQHLTVQGVECTACHPGLDSVDYAGPANMPSMTTCTTCHNNVQATNSCEACHRTFTGLVPADHLSSTFRRQHGYESRVGALDATCGTCHDQNFCAECHAAGSLVEFGRSGLQSDPAARSGATDGPQLSKLTFAHDLNYRFTHGLEAKARTAECYSCHTVQEFCAGCHEGGSGLSPDGFIPTSHFGGGFATVGRGSGGGRHAVLARRDIEQCASCHDAQGADPTCITCHFDADGIRGTDPRTHPAGFHAGEDGPWHTNPGETCYTCHTDANARPGGSKSQGFCGYCHG
jgi:hypothetical protein